MWPHLPSSAWVRHSDLAPPRSGVLLVDCMLAGDDGVMSEREPGPVVTVRSQLNWRILSRPVGTGGGVSPDVADRGAAKVRRKQAIELSALTIARDSRGRDDLAARQLADRGAGRGSLPWREDYDLGIGRFMSTSWDFVTALCEVEPELQRIDGEALCELSLQPVDFQAVSGQRVCYRKPVVTVAGPFRVTLAHPE